MATEHRLIVTTIRAWLAGLLLHLPRQRKLFAGFPAQSSQNLKPHFRHLEEDLALCWSCPFGQFLALFREAPAFHE